MEFLGRYSKVVLEKDDTPPPKAKVSVGVATTEARHLSCLRVLCSFHAPEFNLIHKFLLNLIPPQIKIDPLCVTIDDWNIRPGILWTSLLPRSPIITSIIFSLPPATIMLETHSKNEICINNQLTDFGIFLVQLEFLVLLEAFDTRLPLSMISFHLLQICWAWQISRITFRPLRALVTTI